MFNFVKEAYIQLVKGPINRPCQVGLYSTCQRGLYSSVVDPDPHGSRTFAWIRIQLKVKEYINKTINSGLFVLLDNGQ